MADAEDLKSKSRIVQTKDLLQKHKHLAHTTKHDLTVP
jgi:hypothetical protein